MRSVSFLLLFICSLFAQERFYNEFANITSQCYTKTIDSDGIVHNPCFTCHKKGEPPNYTDDSELQLSYAFPQDALKNRWSNLFVDRSRDISKISDSFIISYIDSHNYSPEKMKKLLSNPKKEWDVDGDGVWGGYVPDCYFNFDNRGFDISPSGAYTGWRAFAYYPFTGTFWPTNGSSDDVLIRLPKIFQTKDGVFDIDTYSLNLSIIESLVKRSNVEIERVDENLYGVDLNRDGKIGYSLEVVYGWSPNEGVYMSPVGDAREAFLKGSVELAGGLYPTGVEFLHTVRYVGVGGGKSGISNRLKELRYSRKNHWLSYSVLHSTTRAKNVEKRLNPDDSEKFQGSIEDGFDNGVGWTYQGFIEDVDGELRPQNSEEMLFCMGCHSNLGATVDSGFSYHRRIDGGFRNGWYHWSQKDLRGVPEPVLEDGRGEYSLYLLENRAGDEFRENSEVVSKFFHKDGRVKRSSFKRLENDMGFLIYPSVHRALRLNKAYYLIVKEQSYTKGRDVNVAPSKNVHKKLSADEQTGIKKAIDADIKVRQN